MKGHAETTPNLAYHHFLLPETHSERLKILWSPCCLEKEIMDDVP